MYVFHSSRQPPARERRRRQDGPAPTRAVRGHRGTHTWMSLPSVKYTLSSSAPQGTVDQRLPVEQQRRACPRQRGTTSRCECRGARGPRASAAGLSCRRRRSRAGGCREEWNAYISESVFTVLLVIGTLLKTIVLNVRAHAQGVLCGTRLHRLKPERAQPSLAAYTSREGTHTGCCISWDDE